MNLYEQLGLAFYTDYSPSSFIPPTHSSHHSSPVIEPQLPEAGLVNRRRFYSTFNSTDVQFVPDDKLSSFAEVNLDGRSNLSTEFSYISDLEKLEITDLRGDQSFSKAEVLKRLSKIWNGMSILQQEIQTSNTTVLKTEVGDQPKNT